MGHMEEMDWSIDNSVMDEDIDSDDENEIRQLDAVLEEAEISVCDTGSRDIPIPNRNIVGSTPAAILSEHPTLSDIPPNSAVEPPGWCERSTSSHSSVAPHIDHRVQELSKIDAALAINKLYEEKIGRLEKILHLRLRECRQKLDEIQASSAGNDRVEVFRYINCGRPYFRDHNNYPAPDNADTVMAKAEMYDFSLVASVPGWTVRDKNQFTQVMTQISLEMRKEKYNEQILELKSSIADGSKKVIEQQIIKLRRERDSLNSKMPFVQLALPLNEEYDWDLLANKLNRRHTAHEYRCLWKLYFHPSINKSTWKNNEHKALQTLALSNNYQDWDKIARELGTDRTGYQCFVYFRTNMTNPCIGKKWSHEEVTYLKRLIDYFREDFYIPWGKIAAAMENRTKIQIYNKYLRLIEQRKGRFLPQEDSVILNCVQRFGPNFRRITEYLSHRSMVQIRARYQVLSKMRISTVWSVEDDRKLVQIMSNQDPNMTFSTATKFFPGRSRINIRSRYITLVKWIKKHPNMDIEHAPRRGARRLNHGQATNDLNTAIENLKNTLNTEVQVKRSRKRVTFVSEQIDIEDGIVVNLFNEAFRDLQMKKKDDSVSLLPNQTLVSNKQLNLTNLRKCVIILRASIDQSLLMSSHFSDEYPKLGDPTQDVSLFKVKSYSRKDTVQTINFSISPDIWGNNKLATPQYVLAPSYSTITGCKLLMSFANKHSHHIHTVNIPLILKKNKTIKLLLSVLIERFYILFMWPILISNEEYLRILKESMSHRRSHLPGVIRKLNSHKKFYDNDTVAIDWSDDD